jgi:hypothetical protein
MKTSSSRKASIVLVALFLVTTAVSAEPRPVARAHSARIAGLSSVESFSGFWSVLVGLWTKNGCSADPSGICLPTAPAKNGCSLDPNGRCLPTKNGGQADPNGLCLSGPCATTMTTKNGCEIDPNGRCVK